MTFIGKIGLVLLLGLVVTPYLYDSLLYSGAGFVGLNRWH